MSAAARVRAALPRLSWLRRLRRLPRNPAFWYVATLAIVGRVEERISDERLDRLMDWASTNLANIKPSGHPAEAFVASAFVPQESAGVWPLLALSVFSVVAALGARRAVILLAAVHVGVSVATEGLVWLRIHQGSLPDSEAHDWDTGPSYLVVAAMVVAVGLAGQVWLRVLWAVALAVATPSLLQGIGDGDYTAIGHLLSFAIGLSVVIHMRVMRMRDLRRAPLKDSSELGPEMGPEAVALPATPH